jgi:hydrophobe/amphiphile efflux-3 (HAE3) family protein
MITHQLAKLLVSKPKLIILLFTIVTAIVGLQIQNVYIVSDLSEYLPPDHPSIVLWRELNKEFQISSTIVIYVEADDIRDPYVLQEMDRISSKINIYELDKGEKDGIYSVRSIAALIKQENAKPISIGSLGGTGKNEIPDDRNLIARYITRSSVQAMQGVLYLKNYKVAVIIFQVAQGADYTSILSEVESLLEKESRYADMTVTGLAAMQRAVQQKTMDNIKLVFPVAIVLISIVIFFFNRNIKGVIIVFLPLAFALALTFGIYGMIQPQLTLLSIAIIALLIGLGVDYSIHYLNRFAEEQTIENKIARVEKTLRLTGKAVFLSTITTVIGFGSLMVSSMPPIISFGFGCVMGILFCFISATILVPCLALILKFEKNGHEQNWKRIANFAIDNRYRVAIIAVFFTILSLAALPVIRPETNFLDITPEGLPEVEKYIQYSKDFGGGTNINMLLIETDPQGLTYPDTIDAIYAMEQKILATGATVTSLTETIRLVDEVLERNRLVERLAEIAGVEEIVFDRIAAEGLIDEDYSKTVVIVTFPVGITSENLEKMVNEVNTIAAETHIPKNGVVSELAGQDAVNVEINKLLFDEQTRSLIVALLFVLTVLILIFNSTSYGVLTLIPVLFVLMWEPGFLVILDIPLSVITISIAAIMIGIGIDYGIHITQRIRENIETGMSINEATRDSIEKTGLSIVEAAMTTIAGIASVYFVDIPSLHHFGSIIIIMTISSLLAAVLILPIFYSLKFKK